MRFTCGNHESNFFIFKHSDKIICWIQEKLYHENDGTSSSVRQWDKLGPSVESGCAAAINERVLRRCQKHFA